MGGGSLYPLSMILKENRLTGPNYIDWKRNLNLVLTAEDYKFVLIDVCTHRLQIATLRKRMSRPIRNGGRLMRWHDAIY